MESRHGKVRMKVEGDRLSNLPNDLIHKILSFVGIKHAIQTSALSSRWRSIWTSLPYLTFPNTDLYDDSVTHVMSGRNDQIEVSSVELTFAGIVSQLYGKRILDYALSHNVQQLVINCFPFGRKDVFPLSPFSCRSLKRLTMSGCTYEHFIMTPATWELPALATLDLDEITLYDTTDKCDGVFANFVNLKSLALKNCEVKGLNGFNICHPGLSSLTLRYGSQGVNVVTPQLNNLNIQCWRGIHLLSAPNLSSLHYKDDFYPLKLSTDLLCLETVDICIPYPCKSKENAHKVVSLLQQLHAVKFLALNWEIIKFLSSYVELISSQPSPFANLKRLKISPDYDTLWEQTQPEVTMATEVKNYLLDSSSGASLTMVSHEETRAVLNVASAQNLMRELQVVLDQLNENGEINASDSEEHKASMERLKATMLRAQPDMKIRWHFLEGMEHIKSYWEDLNVQLEKGYENAGRINSMLRGIEEVLAKLPASHRTKLQTRFSGLCAEADTVMDNMMDRWKTQCDKKPRYFKCLLS